jgi:RNA polymerase sigma factor (TIGR02999 family)
MSDKEHPDTAQIRATLARTTKQDVAAAEFLFPIVYDELRNLAAARMQGERRNHTLRPTALVNEAYLKLADQSEAKIQSKSHFVAIASIAMQRILADHARAKGARKRGGDRVREALNDDAPGPEQEIDNEVLEAIAMSIERLAEVDLRKATVIRLRILGGMSIPEVSEVLGVAPSTVSADWKGAKDWIADELNLEI